MSSPELDDFGLSKIMNNGRFVEIDKSSPLAYAIVYANGVLQETTMQIERHVRLFRNGRNQALRIPREFELEGNEAIIRKDGDKLIIEPVPKNSLLDLLATWKPMEQDVPEIKDTPVEPEEIF